MGSWHLPLRVHVCINLKFMTSGIVYNDLDGGEKQRALDFLLCYDLIRIPYLPVCDECKMLRAGGEGW